MDNSNTTTKKLEQNIFDQLSRFPESPGVYIMKDESDKVLYIGKAINLRNRVRSYFSDSHEDRAHIPVMLQKLDHIDWIATNNETEALILEANLIRTHQPNYNVKLRDDSHFPYLKVTVNEPFPRLLVVRKVEKDGARYFGPYTDVRSMRRLVAFAKRIFRLRDCSKKLPLAKQIRPCINYSMTRCSGPCDKKVSEETYRNNVSDLIRFLSGKRNDLIRDLSRSMEKASEEYRFEDAAILRDQIQLIKDASKLQQVDLKLADTDCDVFGIAQGNRTIGLAVLHFRDSLLISSRNYLFKRTTWEFSNTSHDNILLQFYQDQQDNPPPEVLLPENGGFEQQVLQAWFDQQYSSKTTIQIPQKGTKKILVGMAEKNALLYMVQKAPVSAIDDITDLQKVLCLPKIPEVIEAFDISNLGDSFTVAGMVQFRGGMPNKSGYRRYKIKTVDGQNDFAMMMEVVTRRLRRLQEENHPFPDLLLIDGGPGQLSSALDAIKQFQNPPFVASLAEREEILYSPCVSEPIRLPSTHPARRLVERIRDEVHRYAITYHRKIRGKQFGRSTLEDVEGIGKKSAQMLLKKFGSLERLKNATIEEIAEISGFSEKKARKLKEILSQRDLKKE